MYTEHAKARKSRLVRAYIRAMDAGDDPRLVAIRKALWRLTAQGRVTNPGDTARQLIGERE